MKLFIFFILLTGPIVARGELWIDTGELKPIKIFPIILFKCTTTNNKLVRISYYKGKYKYWFGENNRPEISFLNSNIEILMRGIGEFWGKGSLSNRYSTSYTFFHGDYAYEILGYPLTEWDEKSEKDIYLGHETNIYTLRKNKNINEYEEIGSVKCREETVVNNWITEEIPPIHKLHDDLFLKEGIIAGIYEFYEKYEEKSKNNFQ